MIAPKVADLANDERADLGKPKRTKRKYRATAQMVDKVMGKCKANIEAIDLLDEDQKDYLRRSAKAFLAARRKKAKRLHK
jgi:hypothetical protein